MVSAGQFHHAIPESRAAISRLKRSLICLAGPDLGGANLVEEAVDLAGEVLGL